MSKRILSALLAAAMALSFAGCGSSASSTATSTAASTASSTAASTASSAAASTSGGTIKIGHYGPLTGSTATSGQAGKNGAELCVKMWNAAGGINGKQIEYISYDDQSTAEGATKAVNRLISEDKVDGLIGSQLSANIKATGQIVDDAGIPEVGTGISTSWPEEEWSYLFRALANNTSGPAPLVATMKEIGITKVASLTYQDEGNKNSYTKLKAELDKNSISVTAEEVFQPNDTDWTGQIGSMLNSNPDGLVVLCQGEQLGTLMKQIRSMGFKGYVFGCETCSLPDIRKVAGDDANGLVFYAPYCIPDSVDDANSDAEKTFLEAYVKEYGSMPASDVAYRCYDAMTILLNGFKKAGTTDGQAVRDAIYSITDLKTLAGTANFAETKDGECMHGYQIFITHGGKNMTWEKFKASNSVTTYSK